MKKHILYFILFGNLISAQTQIGIDINGEAASDRSGSAVATSQNGSVIAIGAPRNDGNGADAGQVRVYRNLSGSWTQWGSDLDGDAADDRCGTSVALSSNGSIVAIGSPQFGTNNIGRVRIYSNTNGTWNQIGTAIDGIANAGISGSSVALSSDGTIVAIGAPNYGVGATGRGAVRVFRNVSGSWTQVGGIIVGGNVLQNCGQTVALSSDGSVLAIGYTGSGPSNTEPGFVKIYNNISGTWTPVGAEIVGLNASDEFGRGLSLSANGNTVAIGSQYHNGSGGNSGQVKVYTNNAGTWQQVGANINGEAPFDFSGYGISLSSNGEALAIGAASNDGNGSDSGHVRVYRNVGGTWTQVGIDINGEAAGDGYGFSVALSADANTLTVGGIFNDGNGVDSGHVRVFNLSNLLSVNSFNSNLKFNLYPNPASDILNIETENELKSVEIYSIQGQKVLSAGSKEINISNLTSGLYLVQVTDIDDIIATQKLIIK
jgi:hypothetical protein